MKKLVSILLILCMTLGFSITAMAEDMTITEGVNSLTDAQAVSLVKEGSYGFYRFMGNDEAMYYLDIAPYKNYTQMGKKNDATSLANMKASLKFLKECNDLRAGEGKAPLRVNDEMMAIAQSDTNGSAYIMNHTQQFEVAENIAWGYSDPFAGWYTAEKALYKKGNTSAAGHYLNIINSSYVITGFAMNQYSNYGVTHGQVFHYSDWGSFTVSEYTKRFNEYYNAITDKITYETSIKNIEALSKGFKVRWYKAEKGSGYQIRYSTSSSMSSAKKVTVSGRDSSYKSVKNLVKGKRYYVQVRTYRTLNGTKYYSDWSAKKSVRTK